MGRRLTEDQVEHFRREGWLAPLPAVTGVQAREFRRRIEAFEERTGKPAEGSLKIKAHLAAPWMVDLACHPAILDAVEDLIGPNILLLRSSVFAKDARDPRFVSWHQDSLYYGAAKGDAVTAWVAFTDSNVSNGCLRVSPGTHLKGNLPHVERKEAMNLLARGHTVLEVDEDKAVDLQLKAGEFSIHHERTVHGSKPNGSDDRRIGMAFFYAPTQMASLKGRRRALLVRGVDEHNHWDPETQPRYDLDPTALAEMEEVFGRFAAGAFKV